MNDTNDVWVPTQKRGGVRRQRAVAQLVERHSEEVEERKRRESDISTDVASVEESKARVRTRILSVLGGSSRTGFKSPLRDKFKFAWHEKLGVPGCEYVVRWRFEAPWGSIRLHHWLAPDDDRAPHDHPWSFTTFVLRGGYYDKSPNGSEHLRAPAIRHRGADHPHTVFPDRDGAWTIIVTGPKVRQWGFWVKGKFVKSYRYFYKFGHHPCD